jgi:anaerobic magnesium-protoporphyrin IX monomethyl ester cyclase
MRVLIVNPPHPSIGSRIPKEQLPPLGLLSIGGPLIDAGHDVTLIDGELGNMPLATLADRVIAHRPQVLMLGHSGSTSAHPIVVELTRNIKARLPDVKVIYGGVFPTYHYREILQQEPQIDVCVRGEGEATITRLVNAIERNEDLAWVDGIALRRDGVVIETAPAAMIEDLDAYRVGWELIDHKNYGYYGGMRAVVMQSARAICTDPSGNCCRTTQTRSRRCTSRRTGGRGTSGRL